MPSTGQLQAVRRAGCCLASSVLWCRLCPVPAWSHGLAEHPWQSPGQLQPAAMCVAGQAVLAAAGRGHILTFFQETGGLVTYSLYWEPLCL